MRDRSIETRNLLNPAFCGLIYASIVTGYNLKSRSSIPYYLPYILMPIILHKESRLKIPDTSATKFHSWLQNSEEIKIGLAERAVNLKPFVSEAVMFLHGQGHIKSDSEFGISVVKQSSINTMLKNSPMISDYIKKAKTIGAMCGKNNSALTIMALLGVQP